MRHVVKSDEVAHLWAHQAQDSARTAQGNYYFTGDTIYSYGLHFPIARIVKHGERTAVLFTTRQYSSTTSGHIASVKRAIPADMEVFHVYRPTQSPALTIKDLNTSIKLAAGALRAGYLKPVMHRNKRVELYHKIQADLDLARRMSDWFGLQTAVVTPELPDGIVELAADVARVKQESADKRTANREAKYSAAREREEKRRVELAARMPEIMDHWRTYGQMPVIPIMGESDYHPRAYDFPTMLRIEGDEIATSQGARFPLAHADRAIALVEMVRARGEDWKANGHTCKLGHYQIDKIAADGTVYAGCHTVNYSEVQHIAVQLEQLKARS